jgi:hypothetical protein
MLSRRACTLWLLLALVIPGVAAADPPALTPKLVLPPLSKLTLLVPRLLDPAASSIPSVGEPMASSRFPLLSALFANDYWHLPALTLASNFLPEMQRTMRIETFAVTSGPWGVRGATVHQPSRLSECGRDCLDGTWNGRVRLDYDLGKMGRVQNASPFLEVVRQGTSSLRTHGSVLVHAGVTGHF